MKWVDFKAFLTNKGIPASQISYSQVTMLDQQMYLLQISKGGMTLSCSILIEDPVNSDQTDFEANYKSSAVDVWPSV